MNNKRLLPFIIVGVIALFIVMGISSSIFYTLDATERAVIFYKFGAGLDKENIFQPGFHMKAPWNDVIIFEVSEITSEENMDINDKNGLPIHVDVTVTVFPYNDKIGHLYEKFRTDINACRLVIPDK